MDTNSYSKRLGCSHHGYIHFLNAIRERHTNTEKSKNKRGKDQEIARRNHC